MTCSRSSSCSIFARFSLMPTCHTGGPYQKNPIFRISSNRAASPEGHPGHVPTSVGRLSLNVMSGAAPNSVR